MATGTHPTPTNPDGKWGHSCPECYADFDSYGQCNCWDRLHGEVYDNEEPEPCEHDRAEFHPGSPERWDEPGSDPGWYCPDCDEWFDEL